MTTRLAIVLPFISPAGGGVTEAVRMLTAALARTPGYEITVLSFASDTDVEAQQDWPEGVTYRQFKTFGPARYGFAPGMAWHMLTHRYDLVHIHGIWMFHVFAGYLAMLRGVPGIISPHGMLEPWILSRSRKLKAAVSKLYQRAALRRAFAIHVLTKKERGDLDAHLPGLRSEIVPNFVPPAPPPDAPAPWEAQVPQGAPVWLFLARIHEKKGWPALLTAWTQFCEEVPEAEAHLVFCGWIDGESDFETQIAAAPRALYAGPQYGEAKAASYARADVFLLPSMSEGLPMTVLEAAQSGALIAMSAECNLPDFFEGCAIETGTTPLDILNALHRLQAMPREEAEAMRKAARARAEEVYSEAAVLARFAEVYAKASQ
ncbi:glycosyltransferase [Pacificoceanicola onchidii]|uniref:glycosyltransferase n=1 Tax=Pacificoceanicola onchidii TaxID=2562685 RepID=UPI0010A68401|nr:glycosyltransferase [Pacificoceanicola onchidii]